jgi:hypothetical protein
MKIIDVDAGPQYAMAAAIDAQEQTKQFMCLHSPAKQAVAGNLKLLAQDAYTMSRVFLNAREKFLVVKVSAVNRIDVRDRMAQIKALESYVSSDPSIEVIGTKRAKSLLFHIHP